MLALDLLWGLGLVWWFHDVSQKHYRWIILVMMGAWICQDSVAIRCARWLIDYRAQARE